MRERKISRKINEPSPFGGYKSTWLGLMIGHTELINPILGLKDLDDKEISTTTGADVSLVVKGRRYSSLINCNFNMVDYVEDRSGDVGGIPYKKDDKEYDFLLLFGSDNIDVEPLSDWRMMEKVVYDYKYVAYLLKK